MRVWGHSKKGANYKPAPTPGVRCDRCKHACSHRLRWAGAGWSEG